MARATGCSTSPLLSHDFPFDGFRRNPDPDAFRCHLRMSYGSFEKLLSYIHADLEVDHHMATLHGGAIVPEVCLFCTLCWLAGGTYLDIYDMASLKHPFIRWFGKQSWQYAPARSYRSSSLLPVLNVKKQQKDSNLLVKTEPLQTVWAQSMGVFSGFRFQSKVKSEMFAPFFSGHYQRYGINVQAVCDHMCHFTYLAVAAPSSTGDNNACQECSLCNLIDNHISDTAYMATENLISLYYGTNRRKALYDNFNYYGSQCRI